MIDSLLLVDDNSIDQKLYARLIQRSGLVSHYESCLSGPAALERLAKGPVDLMLLDVNMPGMSGFDMLDMALAEFGPDVARVVIVMLTTSIAVADRARAAEFDIVRGYVAKPLTLAHLKDCDALVQKARGAQPLRGSRTAC